MSIKMRILQAEKKGKPAKLPRLISIEIWERSIDTLASVLGYDGKHSDFLLLLKNACGQVKE